MTAGASKKLIDAMSALKVSERRNSSLQNAVVKAAVLLRKKRTQLALAELQRCIRENGLEVLEKLENGVER